MDWLVEGTASLHQTEALLMKVGRLTMLSASSWNSDLRRMALRQEIRRLMQMLNQTTLLRRPDVPS